MLYLWDRPWALLSDARSRRLTGEEEPVPLGRGAHWIYDDTKTESEALPLPSTPNRAWRENVLGTPLLFDASALPARPDEDRNAEDETKGAKALLDRVKSVWARLRDVEQTLDDPARMWRKLQTRWLDEAAHADPEMDIIVQQARDLPPTLDMLDRASRRVLRRVQRMVPLARVQEVDRKAMTWLIRQPGETIAERAGDRQRIQALTREESFDTLENRVVLSYARLADTVARDYRRRHGAGSRVDAVRRHGARCQTLAREFCARGVREADADVTPNFVLQNNPQYRAVWGAWHDLLRRARRLDDLWRWQARSWEEFCALVVVIALQSRPGARVVAVSPITFLDEQLHGCWIEHINPLCVLFVPDAGVTVEVTYRIPRGPVLAPFGAPIWLRLGRIDSDAFLRRWAIWPLWHADGGLQPSEDQEIATLLPHGRREHVAGGITLRPVADGAASDERRGSNYAGFTIGTVGQALQDGIARLGQYLDDHVLRTV